MPKPFVPTEFEVPQHFEGTGFHLEPLGPEHNRRDHVAWMSSIDHIRASPGMEGREWPLPMTLEENLRDMEMHAAEFAERKAFTYSILDGDEVIGCLYIYPSPEPEIDADVRSWVRSSRADMDRAVRGELTEWLDAEWPFDAISYAPGP
jgi:hypothetical protein